MRRNDKCKQAGRLVYNIAVAYEVLGDLNNAKDWATKAYIEYGEKMANEYIQILNARIMNERIIDQQIPE